MPKTIHTTLFGETPESSKFVHIDNCVCQLYVIKHEDNAFMQNIASEIDKPALYILLNRETKKAYIGQTDSFKKRLAQHLSKPFWNEALCFQASDNSIHITSVRYLEAIAYELAKSVNNYDLSENTQIPTKPTITAQNRFSVEEFFGYVRFLMRFVNCDIFEKPAKKNLDDTHIFYCRQGGCNGRGFYSQEGFTLLAGSELRLEMRSSAQPAIVAKRKKFIAEYCETTKEKYISKCDYTFPSPSIAAAICIGGNANGWTEWKNADGKTLDQIYRSSK